MRDIEHYKACQCCGSFVRVDHYNDYDILDKCNEDEYNVCVKDTKRLVRAESSW